MYLLGEGLGGVLTLAVALRCGAERVHRLLLVNPSTSFPSSPLSRLAPLLATLPQVGSYRRAEAVMLEIGRKLDI